MGQRRAGVSYGHVKVEMLILLLNGFGLIEENRNLILKLKFIMLDEMRVRVTIFKEITTEGLRSYC